MAIYIHTRRPNRLLRLIREAMNQDKHTDRINTWFNTSDGGFMHTTRNEQWVGEATLYPDVIPGVALVFTVKGPPAKDVTTQAYALHSGRFAEMLLARHSEHFTSIEITAQLDPILEDDH